MGPRVIQSGDNPGYMTLDARRIVSYDRPYWNWGADSAERANVERSVSGEAEAGNECP